MYSNNFIGDNFVGNLTGSLKGYYYHNDIAPGLYKIADITFKQGHDNNLYYNTPIEFFVSYRGVPEIVKISIRFNGAKTLSDTAITYLYSSHPNLTAYVAPLDSTKRTFRLYIKAKSTDYLTVFFPLTEIYTTQRCTITFIRSDFFEADEQDETGKYIPHGPSSTMTVKSWQPTLPIKLSKPDTNNNVTVENASEVKEKLGLSGYSFPKWYNYEITTDMCTETGYSKSVDLTITQGFPIAIMGHCIRTDGDDKYTGTNAYTQLCGSTEMTFNSNSKYKYTAIENGQTVTKEGNRDFSGKVKYSYSSNQHKVTVIATDAYRRTYSLKVLVIPNPT